MATTGLHLQKTRPAFAKAMAGRGRRYNIMALTVGKYEIKLGSDDKGQTTYSLFDMLKQEVLPGHRLSMTEIMLDAAELELNERMSS
jgi:hypothetical protein